MPTDDYRNTEYCPALDNVEKKKNILECCIRARHPRANMYSKVRSTSFKKDFCCIYNYKCAYCGVSVDILPMDNFEVDHFVAESLFCDSKEAGKLENLVLACRQCNRNKSNFPIEGEYTNVLNTDDGSIANVFFRDEKYYIRVRKEYVKNKVIERFYNQLKLNYQTRRLDYLLMNIQGLLKRLDGTPEAKSLSWVANKLRSKRNLPCNEPL